eukprot:CAMPEP_0185738406 /NCGR_PEP_ID=MMETSP1171-20130828/32807_1 /TAXON_ID=374046 /ORGANISM="Helicotheca tamensis, Strain CCMP826" /LENGTH=330 /DNA_ID=CAMNT_0028409625 /DNA_START=22 /DNA_END=1011 /DNA_ORIENTATION=+
MMPFSRRKVPCILSACLSSLLVLLMTPKATLAAPKGGLGKFSLTFDSGMFQDAVLNESQEAYALASKPWTVDSLPPTRNVEDIMGKITKASNRVVAKEAVRILTERPLVLELNVKELKKRGGVGGKYRRAIAMTNRKLRAATASGGGKSIGIDMGKTYRAVWKRDLAPNKKIMSPPGVRSINDLDQSKNLKDVMTSNAGDATTVSVLTKTFEDNMKKMYPGTLEIEVTLPNKKGMNIVKKRGYTPPVIVYTFPFAMGNMNPDATLCQCKGSVKVYPLGRKALTVSEAAQAAAMTEEDDGGIEVGVTSIHKGARAPGLVDPNWARGKKFFW